MRFHGTSIECAIHQMGDLVRHCLTDEVLCIRAEQNGIETNTIGTAKCFTGTQPPKIPLNRREFECAGEQFLGAKICFEDFVLHLAESVRWHVHL